MNALLKCPWSGHHYGKSFKLWQWRQVAQGTRETKKEAGKLSWSEAGEPEPYRHIWRYRVISRCWIRHLSKEPARTNWKRGHTGRGVGNWEILSSKPRKTSEKHLRVSQLVPIKTEGAESHQSKGAGSAYSSWRSRCIPQQFSAF